MASGLVGSKLSRAEIEFMLDVFGSYKAAALANGISEPTLRTYANAHGIKFKATKSVVSETRPGRKPKLSDFEIRRKLEEDPLVSRKQLAQDWNVSHQLLYSRLKTMGIPTSIKDYLLYREIQLGIHNSPTSLASRLNKAPING